jgi:hypothetical protein
MEYEDIIKKLDPTFFKMKEVIEENIAEEKDDLEKKWKDTKKDYFDTMAQKMYEKKLKVSKANKLKEAFEDLKNMHGINNIDLDEYGRKLYEDDYQ